MKKKNITLSLQKMMGKKEAEEKIHIKQTPLSIRKRLWLIIINRNDKEAVRKMEDLIRNMK